MNNVEIDKAITRERIRSHLADLSILDRSKINEDGTVDVRGHLFVPSTFTDFRVKFGNVQGSVFCNRTNMINLNGAPRYVSGDFLCNNTMINSLDDAPKYVGGDLVCCNTNVRSLRNIHLTHPDWIIEGILILPSDCTNLLGLALIPGVNNVVLTSTAHTPRDAIAVSRDIFVWQEKLLELGLVDQARP
jgi:hypothetical protein